MEWLLNLDTRLFLAINGWHSPWWDPVMWWISGKFTWWPFYLLLLGYLGVTRRWGVVLVVLFLAAGITLTDQTSVHLFKNVFQRLRPCHDPALEGMVHLVHNKCGGSYGFISSHADNPFGVAVMVAGWVRTGWMTLLMITWATLVGYSRIYLGVHFPGDVLAGAVWGAACGWLILRLYGWLLKKLPIKWRAYVVH